LPDVEVDKDGDNVCVICLVEMQRGKRIGCGHVFHL